MENGTVTPTIVTMRKDELEAVMAKAKAANFTQAQFEREKTRRIAALCHALGTSESWGITSRAFLISQLEGICNSTYAP